jgi:hypothetical protein
MLEEAIAGKKTMAATILATNQRAYRAIVCFAPEKISNLVSSTGIEPVIDP